MNNNEELFGDLFAYRVYLNDIYDNEREIIKKLKIKLYELGYELTNINGLIYDFYRFYGIPDITMDMIESSYIHIYNMRPDNTREIFMRLLSQMANTSLVLDLVNINENINLNEEDEKTTLNEDEFNELEVMILEDDIDNDCSICIDNLRKGNEVIKLKCNHIFHKECIKSYLMNYDNKCPLCRKNILSKEDEANDVNEANEVNNTNELNEIPELAEEDVNEIIEFIESN
jgi:hypothetical protein